MGSSVSCLDATSGFDRYKKSSGVCYKDCYYNGTFADVECQGGEKQKVGNGFGRGGATNRNRRAMGGNVDAPITVSSGTYSVHVDDQGVVSINNQRLTDEQTNTYISSVLPDDPTIYDVVHFDNKTYYVLKTITKILKNGGGARKTKNATKTPKVVKASKSVKSTKTVKKVKASWSPVGKNVKITLPNGNVRSLYKNPDKPGELRIRKMVAAKDGSGTGTVAKYVKPPTSRTNKGRK
jgi:hypothetical protein